MNDLPADRRWGGMLSGQIPFYRRYRRVLGLIPSHHRCKNCNAPFNGVGGLLMRLFAHGPYNKNPRFCNWWFAFWRGRPGGAEIELTVLFIDVRGSTPIAEKMSPDAYSLLLNRFYRVASDVLIRTDAYIDKFVGDEVMAIYLPLFAGREPARQAVAAAQELLTAMGYGENSEPWLPVGVGVHTGPAFFGTVCGSEGTFSDFTALGDTVNVAARLVGAAGPGEALISDVTLSTAGIAPDEWQRRSLEVKGKRERIPVRVLRAGASTAGLTAASPVVQ